MPTHSFGKAYAHYTYHSWDASTNTWYDTSGNDFHSNVATGTVAAVSETASGGLNYLSANWLHGQWNAQSGVAYYEGWQTSYESTVSDAGAWLLFCGQNGGSGYFRANGETVAQSTSGRGNQKLCVNTGVYGHIPACATHCPVLTYETSRPKRRLRSCLRRPRRPQCHGPLARARACARARRR